VAVDVDAALVITKKGAEIPGQIAADFEKVEQKARAAGEAIGWTAEQMKKAQAASEGASGGGAGLGGGGMFPPELMTGAALAAVGAIALVVGTLTAGLRAAKDIAVELFHEFVAGAERAVEAAIAFEKTMTQVKVLSNSSAADMALYNEELLKMGPAVGVGPQKLAEGLLRVTSLGKTGAEALDILRQSAQLSAVGMGEVGTIATAITGAVNSYGSANLSASQAADILTATVREGGAEANAYAATLGRIAPLAAQLGIRFADLGANLAAFTRLGVSASEATTGMSSFMSALLKPTEDGVLALKLFGGTALDTMAKVKSAIKDEGLAQTMVKLMAAFKGHDDALAALIPNVRALRDVMATAGSQGEEYIAIQDRIRNSLGDAQKAFDETAKTAEFQFNSVKASVETAALSVGQTLLPAVQAVLGAIASDLVPALQSMAAWFAKNKDVIEGETVKALTALQNAIAGGISEIDKMKAAFESMTGSPMLTWIKEQIDEWLLLDDVLAKLTGGTSFKKLMELGQAKRNVDYMASLGPSDYVTKPTGGIGDFQIPGGASTAPYAGMGGTAVSPETLASWKAAEEAQKKLADANRQSTVTFEELKSAHNAAAEEAKKHEKAVGDLVKQMQGLGAGTKDVQAIQEALERGGGAINASAEFVKKFGKELTEAAAAGVPLTEEGQKLVALYADQLNAAQLNKDLDKAAAAADAAFKASEKAINGIAAEMKGLGTGKSNVESIEAALLRIGPAGITSAEATKKFGTELLAAAAAGVPLSEAGEKAVAAWLRMKDANATIAEQKRLIQGLGPSVEQLAVKYAALAAAIRAQQASPEGMNNAQRLEAVKQVEEMRDAIKAAGGDTKELDAQLAKLGVNVGLERLRSTMSLVADQVERIAQGFSGSGGVLGGIAGATAGAAGMYKAFEARNADIKANEAKGGSGMSTGAKVQGASNAVSTAIDLWKDNRQNMSKWGAAGSGASKGAAAGAQFGVVGAVVGGAVGALIAVLSGSGFRKMADAAGKILGVEMTKELAVAIDNTKKKLKVDTKSAALLNITTAIESTGRSAASFAPQITDLIKGIADHSIPAKEGMEQLSKSFGMVAAEAAKSKVASQAMFTVMKQARESKVLTEEMTQAIHEAVQAMAAAVPAAFGALNDEGKSTGGLKIMSDESAVAQATIFATVWAATVADVGLTEAARLLGPGLEALQAKLADSGFGAAAAAIFAPIQQQFALATNEMFAGASDAALGFADILHNAINTALPLTIEQLQAFGTVSQDAFAQARDAALEMGMSAEEATRNALIAIAPLLAEQVAAAAAYGIPLDVNTQKLVDQAKAAGIAFAEDPMVKAAEAMERVADALEHVLGLTKDTTKGFNDLGTAAGNVRPPKTGGGGGGGEPPSPPEPFASGGIFRGPMSGRLAMLHGTEAVMTLPQLYGEMAAIISSATADLLSGGGGGGGGKGDSSVYAPTIIQEVNIYVDGSAADGGLEEGAAKWKRMLVENTGFVRQDLEARIDGRIKTLVK
jgi:TP901 family phage tail tape measure protein